MKNFIYTIFISAFLLFQVQPMIAKYVLPWFGGTSAVWSTCLLFFQAGLLIGYGYVHFITKYFSTKNQVKIHLVLLLLSLISIPIFPREWLKPHGNVNPITGIIYLLTLSVGFPYIMVSTTGPLLQSWFAMANPKKSPYRLYALSNLGSLIGLLSYPVLIEPYLNLKTQIWFWSVGYILFIVLCGMTANAIRKIKPVTIKTAIKEKLKISFETKLIWLLLGCMGTVTLLSVTNKLTQDITVVPFLWIIPLTLYLLSFIIAFDNPKWYNRKIFLPATLLAIALILRRQFQAEVLNIETEIGTAIFLYSFGVFIICMTLHGELARIKPDEGNLTLYYFLISVGGVLGGIFINLIVPIIFNGFWEIYCAFIGSVIVIAFVILKTKNNLKTGTQRILFSVTTVSALIGILIVYQKEYASFNDSVIESSRNFYGVLKISEADKGTSNWQRMLTHGDITHGIEFLDSAYERVPISYYGPESGIGLALSVFPTRATSNYQGMKVGMIGLGIGTISAYGTIKDLYKYYEINPNVEILARKYFRFLSDYKGKTEIVNGDGRISLENELKESGSNKFDVLAIDAFSGDVIPTHLITREAVELYFKHLNKNGILAFHITNRYLNLLPVMSGLSESIGKPMYYFFQKGNSTGLADANWVVFTDNQEWLNIPSVKNQIQPYNNMENQNVYWTDDYSSIFPLMQ